MVEITRGKLVRISVFTVVLAVAGGGVALATPITDTEQAVASGTIACDDVQRRQSDDPVDWQHVRRRWRIRLLH